MSEQIFSVALPEAKVVGVTFANTGRNTENRQSIIHNLYMRGMLEPGQAIALERDPENPYDKNAVSVIGPDGRQIGNLSKEYAGFISPLIAKGEKFTAYVASVNGGNGYNYGINIRIEQIQHESAENAGQHTAETEHRDREEVKSQGVIDNNDEDLFFDENPIDDDDFDFLNDDDLDFLNNEYPGDTEPAVSEVINVVKGEAFDFSGAQGVDNTGIVYNGRRISVRLNPNEEEARNRLKENGISLSKKYAPLKEIDAGERLQTLLNSAFPNGLQKVYYVRNLSVKTREHERSCALRLKRFPGDALSAYLPDGETLLFKGRAYGKEFIVDAIYDIADTDRLKFEIESTVTNYSDLNMIGSNFIFDVCEEVESIAQYTADQLENWRAYLDWRIEITKLQIFGCKYYKREYDSQTGNIVFHLVCDSRETFQKFKKYLRRGIEAFNNNYSKNAWVFEPADFDPKKRFESAELGKFVDIVNEYYLQDDYNEGDTSIETTDDDEEIDNFFEEDDEENSTLQSASQRLDISSVKQAFETPYIVEVAFALKLDEGNGAEESEFEQANKEWQIQRELSRYEPNGFLALSAVGDYVLINRFKRAILQVEKDDYYSPNLVEWLFNIEHARLPLPGDMPIIDKWLNPGIATNENQRTAVQKMLAAPDICLIQGPPGTGKTTVIAEAIYQFVRLGKRVLIASQSNDAVDNALERLAETPEIRAIRLGRSAKRKRIAEENLTQKYSEREALWYYYKSIAGFVSSTWLDKWSALEKKREELDTAIAAVSRLTADIKSDSGLRDRRSNEALNKANELRRAKYITRKAREENEDISSAKRNYAAFISYMEGEQTEAITLQGPIISIIGNEINNIIRNAQTRGIQLAYDVLTGEEENNIADNRNLEQCLDVISLLHNILEKCHISQNNTGNPKDSAEYKQLEFKKKTLNDLLLKANEEDDEDTVDETLAKLRDLKKQMDRLSSTTAVVELSISESDILSDKIKTSIAAGNINYAVNQLTVVIESWKKAIDKAISNIQIYLESLEFNDIGRLEEEEKVIQGQLDVIQDDITTCEQRINTSRSSLDEIRENFNIDEDSADRITKRLIALRQSNAQALDKQSIVRSQWEDTLSGFVHRLTDQNTYVYDYDTFNDTYIRSCNVVGVSCTGDMRSLQERGQNDFDVAIIDEVSKATPPELLIPLMRARKAILVGDHRQLPPMFKEHESSYKEMIQQMSETDEENETILTLDNFRRFEDMVTSSLFKKFFEVADESIKHSLLTQFRMHTDIMNVINRFYDGNLEQGLSPEQQAKTKSHELTLKAVDGTSLILPNNHAYWIDSSALPSGTPVYESRPNGSTSQMNILEIHLIMALLKKLAIAYKEKGYTSSKPKDIGIISFYQAQITELRKVFREEKKRFDFSALSVDINTVDRFQGKEKSIIITSLVRNNKSGNASKHIAAFERINVAFSRAQQLLLIVGSKRMYERVMVELPNMSDTGHKTLKVYNDIIQELTRKACFKTSEKLIDADEEESILQDIKKAGEQQ